MQWVGKRVLGALWRGKFQLPFVDAYREFVKRERIVYGFYFKGTTT